MTYRPPVPKLSPTLMKRLEELLDAPERSAADMKVLVQRHLRRVEAASSSDPFIDLGEAVKVAQACTALLNAYATLPPVNRGWVRAACLYFAESDDEDDDFESITGFDDDAEVVNHVAARVGLSRLSIRRR